MRGRYHSAIACEDCGGHEFFPCGTCIACHERAKAEAAPIPGRRKRMDPRSIEQPEPYEHRRPQAAREPRIDPFAGGAFAATNRRLASAGR